MTKRRVQLSKQKQTRKQREQDVQGEGAAQDTERASTASRRGRSVSSTAGRWLRKTTP